jgi:hypothetical protein
MNDLQAIKARATASTANLQEFAESGDYWIQEAVNGCPSHQPETIFGSDQIAAADVAFICAARADVLALVAEIEALREIARAAHAVRDAQRTYFRDRTPANLTASKALERALDQRLAAYAAAPTAAQAGMVI